MKVDKIESYSFKGLLEQTLGTVKQLDKEQRVEQPNLVTEEDEQGETRYSMILTVLEQGEEISQDSYSVVECRKCGADISDSECVLCEDCF